MSNGIEPSIPITRASLMDLPFPHKLWIIIEMEQCRFVRWNTLGAIVLVDPVDLSKYLESRESIFRIKTLATFIEHMQQFQFQQLVDVQDKEHGSFLMEFYHKHFQRKRIDLLPNVRRSVYQQQQQVTKTNAGPHCNDERINMGAKLMKARGDYCFMKFGELSTMQIKRIGMATQVQFERTARSLKENIEKANRLAVDKEVETLPDGSVVVLDPLIEVSADYYENPIDTVMPIEKSGSIYAGYYGDVDSEEIKKFFGDYLPKYQLDDNSVFIPGMSAGNKNAKPTDNCPSNAAIESTSIKSGRYKFLQAENKRNVLQALSQQMECNQLASADDFLRAHNSESPIGKCDPDVNFMLPQKYLPNSDEQRMACNGDPNEYTPQILTDDGVLQGNPFMEPMRIMITYPEQRQPLYVDISPAPMEVEQDGGEVKLDENQPVVPHTDDQNDYTSPSSEYYEDEDVDFDFSHIEEYSSEFKTHGDLTKEQIPNIGSEVTIPASNDDPSADVGNQVTEQLESVEILESIYANGTSSQN